MAKVHILNVNVHNNPAPFYTPFQFEINFECLEELQDDLEFKIIYVGSAETVEFDQTLDQIVVDAVPKGQFKFMFQADPPDTAKIPADDAVGVTVVLITASYRDQEFVRVGYYVNNEYDDPELKDNPPSEPLFDKLVRTIASDQPRVTKFKINWDSSTSVGAGAEAAATSSELAGNLNSQDSEMAVESATTQPTTNGNMNGNSNFENKENINEFKKKCSINENSGKLIENSHDSSLMS